MPLTPSLLLRRAAAVLAAVSVLGATGCAPRMIPNTQIRDTADNRAILEVVRRYKQAFEAMDVAAITALASTRYHDAGDNITYETLAEDLEKDFRHVKRAQLDLAVKRVEVRGDTAWVDYLYSTNLLIGGVEDEWHTHTDDERMVLVREDGRWRVTSGF